MRKLTAFIPLALVAGLLAGCSGSTSPEPSTPTVDETFVEYEEGTTVTAPVADFEFRIADALEQSAGTRPEVDCGDADLELGDADVVPCTLTDGETTFDVEVTILLTPDGEDYIVAPKVLS